MPEKILAVEDNLNAASCKAIGLPVFFTLMDDLSEIIMGYGTSTEEITNSDRKSIWITLTVASDEFYWDCWRREICLC